MKKLLAVGSLVILSGCAAHECVVPKSLNDFLTCEKNTSKFWDNCDVSKGENLKMFSDCLDEYVLLMKGCDAVYNLESRP